MRRALLAALLAVPAPACDFIADTRPIEARVADQPLAFVGTVLRGGKDSASFKVEHPVKGAATAGKTIEVKVEATSCARSFRAGERWLYAGPDLPDPSARLDAPGGPALKPRPDSPLKLAPAAKRCKADADCAAVYFGCSGRAAAARAKLEEVQAKAWAKFGDPKTLNCVAAKDHDSLILPEPSCRAGSCAILEIVVP